MFSKSVVLALACIAVVDARMARRHHQIAARTNVPSTYAEGYLEPYETYHTRYLAVDCENKHNTPFWDACCHPMLATETLAKNRAPECDPANAAANSSATNSAATSPSDDADDDCDDSDDTDDSDSSSVNKGAVAAAPAPPAPSSEAPKTSSSAAPEPSSSAAPKPSPSPSPSPKPSSSSKAPAPAPTTSQSSGNNGGGDVKTGGIATYFYQKGNAGACGHYNPDSAVIAAIDSAIYSQEHCGKQIEITNTKNGKKVTVTVADECPTCNNANSIDLSTGAFDQIASETDGTAPISWKWL